MPINEDRGEALIRQRIRERKRDKRTKQRDNSDADASRSLISDSTEKPQSQSVSNPPHVCIVPRQWKRRTWSCALR